MSREYLLLLRRARRAFDAQKQRCYNPKNPKFKFWGAKGITVEYSWFEFLNWYLSKMKNPLPREAVGRIDHSKPYRLDNIERQTATENSQEVCNRTKARAIEVTCTVTGGKRTFPSVRTAARQVGIDEACLSRFAGSGKVSKKYHVAARYL